MLIFYFTFFTFQITKRIEQYFQIFGEVESFRVHTKGDFQFAFVQYKSYEAAKTVLTKWKHRVANRTITVKPAHDRHQPDFEEFQPPPQDSPRNILNALNDDCLERMFKLFNLVDLTAAADVCVRFQQHAIDVFNLKYKHVVKREDIAEFKGPVKFKMMLRHFGSLIHSLSIDKNYLKGNAVDLLNMISEYAPVLKELTLDGFNVGGGGNGSVNGVHKLFARLEKLTLFECEFKNGARKLFASCAELKHLSLNMCEWNNRCIDQKFPKLEEMHLYDFSDMEDDELEMFIISNPSLKRMSICDNMNSYEVDMMQTIGEHLKNLEELKIDEIFFDERSEFQSLGDLPLLRKLSLDANFHSVAPLIKMLAEKAVPLEYLALEDTEMDSNAIRSMSKLTKLNEIQLSCVSDLTDEHVIELAKELPQLREIHLKESTAKDITTIGLRNILGHAKKLSHLVLESASNVQIDMSDYRSMLKSVQNRPEKIKLEIKITGNGNKVNVPEDVLSANREWLWIDEEVVEKIAYFGGDDDDDDDDDFDYDFDDNNYFYDSDNYYGSEYGFGYGIGYGFDFGYNYYSDSD